MLWLFMSAAAAAAALSVRRYRVLVAAGIVTAPPSLCAVLCAAIGFIVMVELTSIIAQLSHYDSYSVDGVGTPGVFFYTQFVDLFAQVCYSARRVAWIRCCCLALLFLFVVLVLALLLLSLLVCCCWSHRECHASVLAFTAPALPPP